MPMQQNLIKEIFLHKQSIKIIKDFLQKNIQKILDIKLFPQQFSMDIFFSHNIMLWNLHRFF